MRREEAVNGKLSLMGCCGFAYFGLGNLWYHLGEEDKTFCEAQRNAEHVITLRQEQHLQPSPK